jgi:DNA-binding response OmpR family regulator
LDWNLGSESGLELCQEYRKKGGTVPILMLTGRSETASKVMGLSEGADDYLSKPFAVSELNARVNAILRRSRETYISLKLGDLELDPRRSVVIRNNEVIELRPLEAALLEFLMRHPDQFFSSNDLLNRVWSSESDSSEDAVRKTVNRIRQKIDVIGKESYISNLKNLGYKIFVP